MIPVETVRVAETLPTSKVSMSDIPTESDEYLDHMRFCRQADRIDKLVEEGSIRGRQLDLLVDLVAGPLEVDQFTNEFTGHRYNGIADRVERLEVRGNGGGGLTAKMTWTSTLRVAVLTSAMTGGALVAAALINRL